MCGIAGKVHFDADEPVSRALIRRMTDTIAHRGPDGQGHHVSGPIGLGHRRLSIIDLTEAGAQPMSNEDGSVWITFNGEIYNYAELRRGLIDKGHVFRSHTDPGRVAPRLQAPRADEAPGAAVPGHSGRRGRPGRQKGGPG
jgi:asparagine synthase (glutamine-hydrolysing)